MSTTHEAKVVLLWKITLIRNLVWVGIWISPVLLKQMSFDVTWLQNYLSRGSSSTRIKVTNYIYISCSCKWVAFLLIFTFSSILHPWFYFYWSIFFSEVLYFIHYMVQILLGLPKRQKPDRHKLASLWSQSSHSANKRIWFWFAHFILWIQICRVKQTKRLRNCMEKIPCDTALFQKK